MPKVLVIEDDPVLAQLTTYVLEREGIETATASDGPSGLAAIAELRPEVVIVDLTLPGMPGDEVCRRVRRDPRFAHTHLIIVSAVDESEGRRRAREAGADAFVCKPCDPDRVVVAVREGFAGRAASAASAS